jgi:hypothetical protein
LAAGIAVRFGGLRRLQPGLDSFVSGAISRSASSDTRINLANPEPFAKQIPSEAIHFLCSATAPNTSGGWDNTRKNRSIPAILFRATTVVGPNPFSLAS